MGTGELLRCVPVSVHGHDVDVGMAEQLVDHLEDEGEGVPGQTGLLLPWYDPVDHRGPSTQSYLKVNYYITQ